MKNTGTHERIWNAQNTKQINKLHVMENLTLSTPAALKKTLFFYSS